MCQSGCLCFGFCNWVYMALVGLSESLGREDMVDCKNNFFGLDQHMDMECSLYCSSYLDLHYHSMFDF